MWLILSRTQLKVGQTQTDTKTSVMLCGSFCQVTSRLLKTSSLIPPESCQLYIRVSVVALLTFHKVLCLVSKLWYPKSAHWIFHRILIRSMLSEHRSIPY